MDHRTQLPAVGPQGSQNGHIFDDFDRFLPFPRGSIGKLSFSSLIRRVFFQKFMKNDPFLGGVQLGGVQKVCLLGSVENSGHFPRTIFVCCLGLKVRNAIDIVTHKKWHTRRIRLEKSVSSGIGREFRALSVAQVYVFSFVACAMQ